MSAIVAIARVDLRSFSRDPLLRAMLLAPIGLMGLLTLGVPLTEGWLAASYGLELSAHRPVLVALLTVVVLPLLFGSFAGLLLLEDRESGALPAIAVSPAGARLYLAVRAGWAGVAAAIAIGGALALEPGIPQSVAAVVALLGGGLGSVLALLTGSLANDRLEGMAVMKATMIPLAAVLLVTVIDAPWSWPLAVLPSYGPVVTLLDGMAGTSVLRAAGFGAVQLGLWMWLLAHRILRRIG